MPTLKSVKSLSDRVLRGAPLTLRTRYRPPSSSPSFVLHPRLRNCSQSSFSALFTGFVTGTFSIQSPSFVLNPRLRNRSPSSSPLPSSVLHPRLRNCSPFSFSALFTGFVSGTVLHPRFQPCSQDSSPSPSSIPVFSRPVFWGCY